MGLPFITHMLLLMYRILPQKITELSECITAIAAIEQATAMSVAEWRRSTEASSLAYDLTHCMPCVYKCML